MFVYLIALPEPNISRLCFQAYARVIEQLVLILEEQYGRHGSKVESCFNGRLLSMLVT